MWWISVALAEPPRIEVEPPWVAGEITLEASPSEVRTFLSDPAHLFAIDPTGAQILSTVAEGVCTRIVSQVRRPLLQLDLTTRLCPTETGVREQLIDSDRLTRHEVEWSVRDAPDGRSHVTLRVWTEAARIPDLIVRLESQRAVRGTLAALAGALAQP